MTYTISPYARIVRQIADEMTDAVRARARHDDYRPLGVYVSPRDGGHAIGHAGQHAGLWYSGPIITHATEYDAIPTRLYDALLSAPLFAVSGTDKSAS